MKKPSYDQCLEKLYALGRFGIKLELDTITGILNRLDAPEKKFKAIHIAGTNGKGSIASTIAAILQAAGISTGLYTSPHLVKFNERFAINGVPVSDDEIVEAYVAVNQADIGERKATFFELATAMGFYLFARRNVSWAVIETGMGGRLDATNILVPELSIITNLSIEHTDYLGDTLAQIAGEKAGIIKKGVPVITGVSQPDALAVIQQTAKEKNAPLFTAGRDFSVIPRTDTPPGDRCFDYQGKTCTWEKLATPLPGAHQMDNAALALAACEVLTQTPSAPCLTQDQIRTGMAAVKWPGRLEYIRRNPDVILDGAHNLEAAENLGRFLAKEVTKGPLTLVVGILSDKPYEKMLAHLVPPVDRIIFTRPRINRNLDPQQLKDVASRMTQVPMEIIDAVPHAVAHAIETTPAEGTVCVAGSLYVAGEARAYLTASPVSASPV